MGYAVKSDKEHEDLDVHAHVQPCSHTSRRLCKAPASHPNASRCSSTGSIENLLCEESAALVRLPLGKSFDSSLRDLITSAWKVTLTEIQILKRPDGSNWTLGSGAYGIVFKALRNGVQPVAVKVLKSSSASCSELDEFAREILVLTACKDPNIVTFLGACLEEPNTMLVTEYCEGGSLLANIRAKKVNWYQKGRKIALGVARGLVFLHSKRIVHFDLKSPNVLLTRDGRAKIADVGMAKTVHKDLTAVNGNNGTWAWTSPEVLVGDRCTERSDIYSFGVLLWEICTGEVPERGRLRDLQCPSDCPPSVRQLVLDCLNACPGSRPTARQLVDRLAAVSEGAMPAQRRSCSAGAIASLCSQPLKPCTSLPSALRLDSPTASPRQPAALCWAPGPSATSPVPVGGPHPTLTSGTGEGRGVQVAQPARALASDPSDISDLVAHSAEAGANAQMHLWQPVAAGTQRCTPGSPSKRPSLPSSPGAGAVQQSESEHCDTSLHTFNRTGVVPLEATILVGLHT